MLCFLNPAYHTPPALLPVKMPGKTVKAGRRIKGFCRLRFVRNYNRNEINIKFGSKRTNMEEWIQMLPPKKNW